MHTSRFCGYDITRVDFPSMDNCADLCRALSSAESVNFELGLDWFNNLASSGLDEGEKSFLYIACSGSGEVTALPIRVSTQLSSSQSLSNFYTSRYEPISTATDATESLRVLFDYIASDQKMAQLRIYPMDRPSAIFQQAARALQNSRWIGAHEYFCFGNWKTDCSNTPYATYCQSLPSTLRNTLKRKGKRFTKDGRGKLEIVTELQGVKCSAIATFTQIYNASWKRPEPHPDFIPQLMLLASRRGWLRLGLAYYDGEAVAAQLWVVHQGRASIYKLAYNADYKQLSVGSLLTAHLMQHVIDCDNVDEIDYLIGDEPYKSDWMQVRGERWGLAAYNPGTIKGVLSASKSMLSRLIKPLLR